MVPRMQYNYLYLITEIFKVGFIPTIYFHQLLIIVLSLERINSMILDISSKCNANFRFYICSLYFSSKGRKQMDKKEPSSSIAEQMVRFASIIGSIFEIANNQHGDVSTFN